MPEHQNEDQFTGTDEERRNIENALPQRAPATPEQPRKLLIVTLNVRNGTVRGGHRSIPYANFALQSMGSTTGAYETVCSNDLDTFRPDNLTKYDAICFNNTGGVLFDDVGLRKSLLDFVANGGGFMGIHAAAATFCQYPAYDQFPEFGEMLGAYENGGHPWGANEVITLKLNEPEHPVNASFGGKGFEISDEVFQFSAPYSRDRVRVLVSIDTDKTDMDPKRKFLPERAADRDFAMSWVRSHGRGRVFYSSFGHNPQLFWNPSILGHFLAGIQFVLGDLTCASGPAQTAQGTG